ncbi:MAG: hypothetical protein WB579_23530 [Bryobacteraceae bacterium]
MYFTIAAAAVFIGLVSTLVKLVRDFASPQRLPVTADWIDELSVDRYRPMLRLLNQEDLRLLRTQPGCTPQMVAAFRIQRRQIFQMYLRQLESDFKLLCMALKVVMVHSKYDRPDLALVLLRNQVTFVYGLMMVRFQSACYRYGVGAVDVTCLLKRIDGMRLELRTLVPAESYTGA